MHLDCFRDLVHSVYRFILYGQTCLKNKLFVIVIAIVINRLILQIVRQRT